MNSRGTTRWSTGLAIGILLLGVSLAGGQQPTPATRGGSAAQFHGGEFHEASPQHHHQQQHGPGPAPHARCGVACDGCSACRELTWSAERPIPWQVFAQGEYIGPARQRHMPVYRLRVDDTIEFIYRLTARPSTKPYEFEVGDLIRVHSLSAEEIAHELHVQPDGTITLPMLGQVVAAGRTVEELRDDLERQFTKYIRNPAITVTPQKFNTRLEEFRSTVDNRYGAGGQSRTARVTPEGTVQLPAIGSVHVQGLTLAEVKREIEERYTRIVSGLEITPVLAERAPRFLFVVGEVKNSGRFVLEGPTTVLQSIAMAGGWNVGAHLRHVVVFRRDENWRLMATRLDLHDALFGKRPCPADEIWLRDSDIVLVPKSPILATDDLIELLFTRGLYGVVPMNVAVNFAKLSSL